MDLKSGAYVGLDVHKETIGAAIARPGCSEPCNQTAAVQRLIERLETRVHGQVLSFCHEAGPGGDKLYRQVTRSSHHGQVVASGLIRRQPGERVKTDHREAVDLARLLRSGCRIPIGRR